MFFTPIQFRDKVIISLDNIGKNEMYVAIPHQSKDFLRTMNDVAFRVSRYADGFPPNKTKLPLFHVCRLFID